MPKDIFMYSSVHTINDGRVFYREAASLAKLYKIQLHIVADFRHKQLFGIEVYGLPAWKKPKDRIKILFILLIRIIKSNFKVYHFHDPELLLFVPIIKLFKRGKIIFDVHENYPLAILDKHWIPFYLKRIVSWLFLFIETICLLGIDQVIFTTERNGVRYKKLKPTSAIRINNLPLNSIFMNEPIAYEKRDKSIIYVGGMAPERGIIEVVKAFNLFRENNKDFTLLLVGRFVRETFKKQVEGLVNQLNLVNHVRVEEGIPYKDISKVLSTCKIGIVNYLPYGNNMSSLPNKIFEYMGAGLPIIASNFDGYREIIEPEKCGILVDPRNEIQICQAMNDIIHNISNAKEMVENSRQAYIEKYNWSIEEIKLLNLYNSLLASRL